MRGIILYGPPAAGKDTITGALTNLDQRFEHFRRLKAGPGRTEGYRMTSSEDIDALRARGEVIWENQRYGASYVVDRGGLLTALERGVPVVHLGQVEAVEAVASAFGQVPWARIYVWCPRAVAEARLYGRGSEDVAERLRAWDATEPLESADLIIDTSQHVPHEVAKLIAERASG
jgi:guanylate kinase